MQQQLRSNREGRDTEWKYVLNIWKGSLIKSREWFFRLQSLSTIFQLIQSQYKDSQALVEYSSYEIERISMVRHTVNERNINVFWDRMSPDCTHVDYDKIRPREEAFNITIFDPR